MLIDLKELYLKEDLVNKVVTLQGWVKNHRKQKNLDLLILMMEHALKVCK